MKTRRKQRRILWLMIVSQLLLTIFVFQWLRSQYFDARNDLRDKLSSLYLDTQDQLIDTLLFRNYVSPALEENKDTVIIAREVEQNIRWKGENGRITVSVNSRPDSFRHISDTLRIRKINENMLMRSMRLFISHAQDSAKGENNRVINFSVTPDTAEFINQFSQRIEGAGMKFLLKWYEDPSGVPSKNSLLVEPLTPFALPAVEIRRYNGHLARSILPQIIFGIVLVTLTALAFVLAFKSISQHVILNDLRNEFINNMTHELKTPVSTIGIALESLSKYNMKEKPEVMEEYLRLASSETRRLEELIARVLDHSLLAETEIAGKFTETDLNSLVTEVATTLRPGIENKGSVGLELFPGGLMIYCDPLLMRSVIFNLIDNSIKYSGPSPVIKIITREEGNTAIVDVNDNGPGIPEEYREKIFEKFFRLPSHNVHNIKGYGLGLSFALLVMKKHGGTITAKNLNPGCSFTLRIPVKK